jgi:hypothetical protein
MPSPSFEIDQQRLCWRSGRGGIARRFEEAGLIGCRLGGERPTSTIHALVPAEQGRASSIGDSLSRSIGFEEAGELIAELAQALA